MKAKVKSLGSVVDLSEYIYDEDGNEYTWDEVELIDDDKWQQVHIQAAIAAMQGMLANPAYQKVQSESGELFGYFYAMNAIMCADALVAELKHGEDVYAECRRMDAINTASVCKNMTKIQKELQKKDDNANIQQ